MLRVRGRVTRGAARALVCLAAIGTFSMLAEAAHAASGPTVTITVSPGPAGSDATPTFAVTTSDDAALTCSLAGPDGYAFTPIDCTSVTPPTLTDAGDYSLSVTATDTDGATSQTADYLLELTGPTISSAVSPVGPSNDTTPTFTIDADSTTTSLTCTLTGPDSYLASPSDCTSVSPTLSTDGTYTLAATATDAAGLTSDTQVSYQLQTAPPVVTASVSTATGGPSSSLVANSATPTFTATAAPGAEGAAISSETCTLTGPGGYSDTPSACASLTPSPALAPDGTYTFTVTAQDALGNIGTATATYALDTSAPALTPTVTAAGSAAATTVSASDLAPTFSYAASATAPATLSAVSCTLTSPSPALTVVATDTGSACADLSAPLGAYGYGTYTYSVTVTDTAANTTTADASYTLLLAPPAVTTTVTVPAGTASSAATANSTVPTFGETSTLSGPSTLSAVSCTLTGPGTTGTLFATTVTGSDAPGVCAGYTATTAGDGTYTWTVAVSATDGDGDTQTTSANATYVLDTAPPAVSTAVSADDGSVLANTTTVANDPTPTFTSTQSIAAPATLAAQTCTLTGPSTFTGVSASGATCTDLPATLGADGLYTWTVSVTDDLGNTASASSSYLLDTVTPTLTSTVNVPGGPASSTSLAGSATDPTFTLTAGDSQPVAAETCALTGPDGPDAVTVFSAADPADCSSVTPALSADGTYTFTASVTDAAGNNASTEVAYTLDRTPPTVSVTVASTGSPTPGAGPVLDNDPSPTFTATVATASSVTLASVTCTLTGPGGTVFSASDVTDCTSPSLPTLGADGTYLYTVTATDSAGNTTAASAAYTLDTVTPTLSVDVSTPTQAATAPALLGSATDPTFAALVDVSGPATVASEICTLTPPSGAPTTFSGSACADDTPALSGDGVYTFAVTVTDTAGNVNSASVSYDLDTAAPTLTTTVATPTLPATTGSLLANSPTPTFAATAAVSAPATIASETCTLTGPTGAVITPATAADCTDYAPTLRGDGAYTFTTVLTDTAGNVATSSTSYVLDTAPVVLSATVATSVYAPTTASLLANSSTPTFDAALAPIPAPAALASESCTITGPAPAVTVVASGTASSCAALAPTLSQDGRYTFSAAATDTAGNASSASVTYVRDTTPVVLTATVTTPGGTASTGPLLANSTTPTFGAAVGPIPAPAAFAAESCTLSGPAPANPVVATATGSSACAALAPTLTADGVYTFGAVAADTAGNTTTSSVSYTLDTATPVVTVSAPSIGKSATPAITATVSVAAPAAVASVSCSLVGPSGTHSATIFAAASVSACQAPAFGSLPGDGSYVYSVNVTDTAGNSAVAQASTILDTATPLDTVTVAVPAGPATTGTLLGDSTGPTFSATPTVAAPATVATLVCSIRTPAGALTVLTPSLCPSYSPTLSAGDGTYVFHSTVTDTAGNTASASVSYTLDTVAPTVTSTVSVPGVGATSTQLLANSVAPTFASTESVAAPAAEVAETCTITGPTGSTIVPASIADCTTYTPVLTGDGAYTFTVSVSDTAGATTVSTVVYTLDSVQVPLAAAVSTPTDPASPGPLLANDPTPTFTTDLGTLAPPDTLLSETCALTTGATTLKTFSSTSACASYRPTLSTDATYTWTVTATDAAHSVSRVGVKYILDTAAVGLTATVANPSTAPGAGSLLSNTPQVEFASTLAPVAAPASLASEGCSITTGAGPTLTSVWSGATSACAAITLPLTADGVYTYSVTATDTAGNTSTATVIYILDTAAPPVTTTVATSADAATTGTLLANSTKPTFDAAPAVAPPAALASETCMLTVPTGGHATPATTTTCTDYAPTLSGDGTYLFAATITDTAGNVTTTSVSYTLDSAPLSVTATVGGPGLTPSAGPVLANVTAPVFDASLATIAAPAALASESCSIMGTGSGGLVGHATALGGHATQVIGGNSQAACAALSATLPGDGVYTFSATATDTAGNTTTVSVTYTLDTASPALTATAAASATAVAVSGSLLANTSNPVFAAVPTVKTPAAVAGETCTLTGPDTSTLVLRNTVAGCAAVSTPLSTDGAYLFAATVTDTAGNATTNSVTYTRDTVAPTVTTTAATTRDAATATMLTANSPTPTFAVTSADAVGVTTVACTLTGPATPPTPASASSTTSTDASTPVSSISADSTVGAVSVLGSATGSGCAAYSPTLGPDGTYTFTATVMDRAGNSNSSAVTYILDTQAPPAPTVTAPASPSNDADPNFAIAGVDNATFTCTLVRNYDITRPAFGPSPCPTTAGPSLETYGDGYFQLSVFQTTDIGNAGPATTVGYTLDTTAPDAPVVTGPASPSPLLDPTWVWTAEPDNYPLTMTCTLTAPDHTVVSTSTACTSPFSADLTGDPDGDYTFAVTLTDEAGNVSTPGTADYDLDPDALVPPTVLPPASPSHNATPQWIIDTPPGATDICTLTGPGYAFGPSACPSDGRFDLSRHANGEYTLHVVASYPSGVQSAASVTTYDYDTAPPPTPVLLYSGGSGPSPFVGFSLPPNTTGRCALADDATVVIASTPCHGAVAYDLSGRPAGTYTLLVYSVDAAGNVSVPLRVTYVYGHVTITTPVPTTGHGSGSGGGGSQPPSQPPTGGGTPQSGSPSTGHVASGPATIAALFHLPARLAQLTSGAAGAGLRAVTNAAEATGGPSFATSLPAGVRQFVDGFDGVLTGASASPARGTFPLVLVGVVLLFLFAQNRIDRRDPKLALAAISADEDMEFRPPTARGIA